MPKDTYTQNPDPKKSDSQVVIDDFKGLSPSPDPHGQQHPGLSAVQVNCNSVHPGELRCRQGIKPVLFS